MESFLSTWWLERKTFNSKNFALSDQHFPRTRVRFFLPNFFAQKRKQGGGRGGRGEEKIEGKTTTSSFFLFLFFLRRRRRRRRRRNSQKRSSKRRKSIERPPGSPSERGAPVKGFFLFFLLVRGCYLLNFFRHFPTHRRRVFFFLRRPLPEWGTIASKVTFFFSISVLGTHTHTHKTDRKIWVNKWNLFFCFVFFLLLFFSASTLAVIIAISFFFYYYRHYRYAPPGIFFPRGRNKKWEKKIKFVFVISLVFKLISLVRIFFMTSQPGAGVFVH